MPGPGARDVSSRLPVSRTAAGVAVPSMKTRTRVIGTETSPSFGRVLRRERELRGLSIRDAAAATRVNIRHLEALEADDFDALPGGAYNKGFLRAYAQFIGLDPEEMVNHYLFEVSRGRQESELVPRPARSGGAGPLVIAAVVLVAAVMAAGLLWALLS